MILYCELTSYRDEKPALGRLQDETYEPIYDSLKEMERLKVSKFATLFDEHDAGNLAIISELVESLSVERLVALELAAALLKSTSLALLMMRDKLTVGQAFDKSRLEERFQIELFGEIEESHKFDELTNYSQLIAVKLFWDLNN